MQSVLGGTIQKAGEAISGAVSSNKKISDMKREMREPSSSQHLTSDFGTKAPSHDEWLAASSENRQGPQLLEDNFAREKVCCSHTSTALFVNAQNRL